MFYQPGMNQPSQQFAPSQQYNQTQQSFDYNSYNSNQQAQHFTPQPQQQQQQPQPQQRVEEKAPTPVPKGPIPAEHQIIATVFDTLLNKCLNSTNVSTVKRKLEDVAKKLELLYDKLRDSTVCFKNY